MKLLRTTAKTAWFAAHLPRLLARARNNRAIIGLCGHRLEQQPGSDPMPGMAIHPDALRAHLCRLQRIGQFITADEAIAPPPSEPGIRFWLTFDDGYRDNAELLLPLLEGLNIPVTLFLTSAWIAGRLPTLAHDAATGYMPPPMTPDDVSMVAKHPLVTIGCHTATHPRLACFDEAQWRDELQGACEELETWTKKPIAHFAYPFGGRTDFDWTAGEFLTKRGLRSVASNFGGSTPGHLPDRHKTGVGSIVHLRRAPIPNTPFATIFDGWVMGMSSPRRDESTRNMFTESTYEKTP